jgi:putative acetyltransferase
MRKSSTQLKIRTFQPSDTEAVHHLFARGMMDFAAGLEEDIRAYVQHSLSDDLADIPSHYLAQPGSHFWVAELDVRVVGIVGIQRRSDTEAELRRMSVAAEARRQGIGWKLLEIAETFCREQGYQRVRLTTVDLLQPAIAMYQKFGFQLVGEESYNQIVGKHFVKHLANRP